MAPPRNVWMQLIRRLTRAGPHSQIPPVISVALCIGYLGCCNWVFIPTGHMYALLYISCMPCCIMCALLHDWDSFCGLLYGAFEGTCKHDLTGPFANFKKMDHLLSKCVRRIGFMKSGTLYPTDGNKIDWFKKKTRPSPFKFVNDQSKGHETTVNQPSFTPWLHLIGVCMFTWPSCKGSEALHLNLQLQSLPCPMGLPV